MAEPLIAIGERIRAVAVAAARIRWPRSRRHATMHAVLLGSFCWIAIVVVGFAGPGDRSIAGPLKGSDFIHFYTLGHLASSHHTDVMYDMAKLHEAQVALVPESEPFLYPTVYPPQAALLFAPFSPLSYRQALLIWNVLTIALYAMIIRATWLRLRGPASEQTLVFITAAAFPPLWSLVLNGQITILVVLGFWLGWLALERNRAYLAGAAFGMLALKPQFGIPLAVIVLACGEWRMLAGAISSVAAQAVAVWLMLGSSAFTAFATSLGTTLTHVDALEAKPYLSHSLRAVTRLLPNWAGLPIWMALVAIVLWYTWKVWRSDAPPRVRLGIVIVASVLVNPHVISYDVTVLALPLMWFTTYMMEPEHQAHVLPFGRMVYWLLAALFVPTAAIIGLQVSVPLMACLFVFITREAARSARPAAPAALAHHRAI